MEQQGSRLRADYEVSWDRDGFFRNVRNQIPQQIAAAPYKSEAPRRQQHTSRFSPEDVPRKRFKVGTNKLINPHLFVHEASPVP